MKTIALTSLLLAACAASQAQPETPMSKTHKDQLQSFFREVMTEGRIDAADRYLDDQIVDHAPWPEQPATVAGFKAGLADLRTSFPDLHVEIERMVAEGDMVAVHLRMRGTQSGPFMGAPASHKAIDIEAMDVVRMNDGRIAEHWGLIDTAKMAEQLGLGH